MVIFLKEVWKESVEELRKRYNISDDGLTSSQVEQIRGKKGENVLQEGKKKSVLQVFAQQFCDLLVVILMIAAIVSMFSGN